MCRKPLSLTHCTSRLSNVWRGGERCNVACVANDSLSLSLSWNRVYCYGLPRYMWSFRRRTLLVTHCPRAFTLLRRFKEPNRTSYLKLLYLCKIRKRFCDTVRLSSFYSGDLLVCNVNYSYILVGQSSRVVFLVVKISNSSLEFCCFVFFNECLIFS